MAILYAHRGAAAELPENTLAAFARALALGADALETDAHLSADGHVMLAHDPGGDRMAGVAKLIRHSSWRELQAWDCGWGFLDGSGQRPHLGRGYGVPRLEDALEAHPDIVFNVDLKQESPSMVEATIRLVRRMNAEPRVRLASFSARTLAEVRAAGYRGQTGLAQSEVARLVLLPLAALRRLRPAGQAAQIPTHVGPIRLDTAAVIGKIHALGLRVDYWTINDPAEAARLVSLGADGIMTDDPARLAPSFKR